MAMKIYRLFSTLLAIIVIACLSGVQGQFQEQYSTPSSEYSTVAPSTSKDPLQYSQFYIMTSEPTPNNPIGAPQQFEIAGNMPSTVYLGEQMQPVPYSQYQSNPAYTRANALWIKGATAWTQYAAVPQGAIVSLFAISPTGGSGSLTSDGQTYSNNYVFYPNSLLTFYAGTIGRHTLSFAIDGQSSNQVMIEVVGGTYTQPNNNPGYYSENYPGYYSENYPGYYPWDYYYPSCPDGQQQCDGQCCPAGQICVNDNCETPSKPLGNSGGYSGSGVTSTNPVNVISTSLVVTAPGTQSSENGETGGNSGGHNKGGNSGSTVQDNSGRNTVQGNEVKCEAGYHVENGICVPDQVNTGGDNTGSNTGMNNIGGSTGRDYPGGSTG
jgi:hypothetical protein